jgi:hypothetical protein
MRVAGPKKNGQAQVEALIRLLLDPVDRKKRQAALKAIKKQAA